MTINELHKKIKKNEIAPLYLLYGTEEYLINETLDLIVDTVIPEDEREFNVSVFDLNEVPLEVALEDAETLPFIGEKRVVIIKEPIFLTAQKDKNKIEHNLKKLENYIINPSPDSVVIFVARYEKLDERKKIVKLIKTHGDVLFATSMDEKMLVTWIKSRVKNGQKQIKDEAAQLLLRIVGTKLMLLANEIDKMILYIGDDELIDEEVIKVIVPRTLEENIFALIDMIVTRRQAEAFTILNDLIEQKEEPIKILSLLSGQFRLIYQVKELSKRGYGQSQAATFIKVHPFRVKRALEQGKQFSEQELVRIIADLAEADYKMKTGKMDKKLLLELFILGLNNENKKEAF
ncbi:DNA polymerase III subunit delta [Calidifontibacillus oryziterrae]|uniref:DNA polymerase III subunit delta n=1 Tax=Calidifontibacillus oryziterrae TaxID=1191699 RepID=UPI00030D9871|nr:DNA polymerase III subunit delta [Calidifontibacillus oryziterrae]